MRKIGLQAELYRFWSPPASRGGARLYHNFRGGELLRADEAFLGGLTLEGYWGLPDGERARLWTRWAEEDWDTIEEVDVSLKYSACWIRSLPGGAWKDCSNWSKAVT